jgi:hypothetical protein
MLCETAKRFEGGGGGGTARPSAGSEDAQHEALRCVFRRLTFYIRLSFSQPSAERVARARTTRLGRSRSSCVSSSSARSRRPSCPRPSTLTLPTSATKSSVSSIVCFVIRHRSCCIVPKSSDRSGGRQERGFWCARPVSQAAVASDAGEKVGMQLYAAKAPTALAGKPSLSSNSNLPIAPLTVSVFPTRLTDGWPAPPVHAWWRTGTSRSAVHRPSVGHTAQPSHLLSHLLNRTETRPPAALQRGK